MEYSDKLLDFFDNPRNVGGFDKDDPWVGTAMLGNPYHGAVIKLQIKVNEKGIIEEAKFKTYGCGSSIAASSLVTEWVRGKPLEQAQALENHWIAKVLALAPSKTHCAVLAEDALKAAIADYRAKRCTVGAG